MSLMVAGEGSGVGPTAAFLASGAAVFAILVVGSQVVQGPVTEAPAGGLLLSATVLALVLATATATFLPRGSGFAWRPDGAVCAGLLITLACTVAVGWEHGPDLLRSVGSVMAPITVPFLAALVERRARDTQRWSAAATLVVTTLSLTRYAVRDPFRDPGCWTDCSLRGVAPLASRDATIAVELALGVATLATAALALGWATLLAVGTSSRRSPRRWLVLAVAIGASTAASSWAVASVLADRELVARLVAAALVQQCLTGALVAVPPLLALRRRHELRSLAAALGDQPLLGTLEATLSRMLGDRDLKVAYWLPQSGDYVDADGERVDEMETRPSITLQRDGQPLARIYVDRLDRELEDVVGSAARLAIDSERLQAEVSAQLADLVAARRRIVAAADDARRAVERVIHDEVQSELVGALLELAQLRSRAAASGRESTVAEADTIAAEVRDLVAALREFSRGVYPAVLDAAGLPAALEALADEAPVALRLHCTGNDSASVESRRAAYLLVRDAVAQAPNRLDISVDLADGVLEVTIIGHPGAVAVDLRDRIGALGGTISAEGGWLRAVLPCG
jgi:signal transduction histidine kinase